MQMRLTARVLSVIAAAAVTFAAGEGLKHVAQGNVDRQTALVDDGESFEPSSGFTIANIKNEDIRTIVKKSFFKKPTIESAQISALKAKLPTVGSGRHFDDAWDLFWYLEFIRDREGLYRAIDDLVTGAYFRQQAKCLNRAGCNVRLDSSNVNADDGDRLFEIIRANFLVPARQAYRSLAFEQAQKLAADAVLLTRKVDFDPVVTSDAYDEVLVMGTFLAQPAAAKGRYPVMDLAALADHLDRRQVDASNFDTTEMAGYVLGIDQLRKGCLAQAADIFLGLAQNSETDSLSDLFGFLALRALARPFIDISLLELEGEQIQVRDCGSMVPADAQAKRFEENFARLRPGIRHAGLGTDLDFYASQARLNDERKPELTKFLAMRAAARIEEKRAAPQGEEARAQMAEETDTKPATQERKPASSDDWISSGASPKSMAWPLEGPVIKGFGKGFDGLDIAVAVGTSVSATSRGVVIYSGDGLKDFGTTVLVRHSQGLVTVYGHLGEAFVSRGDLVERGQTIGASGQSGTATEPKLHFEIRKDSAAVDPMQYLEAKPELPGPATPQAPAESTERGGEAAGGEPSSTDCTDILRMKAGLKAFGYDKVEIDCTETREFLAGVEEFSGLFGLIGSRKEVLAKMREVGLVN